MSLYGIPSLLLLGCGLFFFVGGTVALVRFPDVYCRLHALTKADNVGLGLIVLAVLLHEASVGKAVVLGIVWLTVQVASAVVSFLVANEARRRGIRPWRREG